MPTRTITADGRTWTVFPSGRVTQLSLDEFALVFVAAGADPAAREIRVARYSPMGTRSREQSYVELTDVELQRLLHHSQPSDTSPEAGYLP